MGKFVLKRFLSMILTLIIISALTFTLMKLIPGSPFDGEKISKEILVKLNEQYGLNEPILNQYFIYMGNFLKGDFGMSYQKVGITVNKLIEIGAPYSLRIGGLASVFIITTGVSFGIFAALKRDSIIDRSLMFFATLGVTIPAFALASGYIAIFARTLGWVPPFFNATETTWQHYIGPVICIGGFSLAFITRLTRTSLIEVMQQDYIRTSRAYGIPEGKVILKYALRNALIPVVTYIVPMIGGIMTGSFIIEKIFAIPGIGKYFTESISNRDYTLIMGMTMFYAMINVSLIFVMDMLYAVIDPRIKLD